MDFWWNFNPMERESSDTVFSSPILLFVPNIKEVQVIWKSSGIFH
jgi:hypothetical protein